MKYLDELIFTMDFLNAPFATLASEGGQVAGSQRADHGVGNAQHAAGGRRFQSRYWTM